MNYRVALLLFLMASVCLLSRRARGQDALPDQGPSRERVASVCEEPIYLDQIKMKKDSSSGTPSEGDAVLSNELACLRSIIRKMVIRQEVKERGIEVSEDEAELKANELAEHDWELLGETESERYDILEKVRLQNQKIYEALKILDGGDEQRADQFAISELLPLGLTMEHWEWLKSKREDPETRRIIERSRSYDKEMFVHERTAHARSSLRIEKLVQSVATEESVYVSNQQVDRAVEMIKSVALVDLVVGSGRVDPLKEFRETLAAEGPAALDAAGDVNLTWATLRLDELASSGSWPNEDPLFSMTAMYSPSTNSGAVSQVFYVYSELRCEANVMYIVASESSCDSSSAQIVSRDDIRDCLQRFAEHQAFEKFLFTKAREETIMYDHRYNCIWDR